MTRKVKMDDEENVIKSEEVVKLVAESVLPSGWNFGTSKITYGLLNEIFYCLEELSQPTSRIYHICVIDIVSEIIKKPSNLKRTVTKEILKSPDATKIIFLKLYPEADESRLLKEEILQQYEVNRCMLYSVMNSSKDSIVSVNEKLPVFPITNQFLIELYDAKEGLYATWVNLRD